MDSTQTDQFTVTFDEIQPKFQRPELLTHPHIPRQAHGVNPRTFKGKEWWNEKRREAYLVNNGCCWACGGYPGDNPYKPHLEAHESYNIYYHIGIIELREIVALCYSCHNFIHSGRLRILMATGQVPYSQVVDILESRMEILLDNGLEPFYGTLALFYHVIGNMPYYSALMEVEAQGKTALATLMPVPRHLWMLVVGEEVYSVNGRRLV